MFALTLANAFDQDNQKLCIVATKRGNLYHYFQENNFSLRIVKRRVLVDPVYIYRIYKICKSNNIQIIHAHQLLECLNAYILSILTGYKVFLTYHGYYYFTKNKIVKVLGLYIADRIAANIFVSNTLKKHYEQTYKLNKTQNLVLYNGITPIALDKNKEYVLREDFNISKRALVLGMVGNFSNARNHLLVCKAYNLIIRKADQTREIHLIFIGEHDNGNNSSFKEVYSYCERHGLLEKVHFTGALPMARNLIHNFDVFVYATHRETFCLSVIEAIIEGIPVVVNDIPVMKELSLDGNLVTLYKTDNAQEMAKGINKIIKNMPVQLIKSKKAKDKAIELYSIEKHIQNLLNIYQNY